MNFFRRGLYILFIIFIAPSIYAVCATITWTAPGDDGYTGQALKYDIRFSTSYINDYNWDLATKMISPPKPKIAGSDEKVVVGGLEPDRFYYFAIKTVDESDNWSGLSRITSVLAPIEICEGSTGNIDCSLDNSCNLADLTRLIDFVYISKKPLCCPLQANTSGDLSGQSDLSDITRMIDFLYINNTPTASCQ